MNTAVNAVVQIEPFKFFHNINDSIRNYQEEDSSSSDLQSQTSNVGINLPGRSNKPAGIAHLGERKSSHVVILLFYLERRIYF